MFFVLPFVVDSCSFPMRSKMTLALSGPLFTYLQRYFRTLLLLTYSTFICAWYFFSKFKLCGTTHLLSKLCCPLRMKIPLSFLRYCVNPVSVNVVLSWN